MDILVTGHTKKSFADALNRVRLLLQLLAQSPIGRLIIWLVSLAKQAGKTTLQGVWRFIKLSLFLIVTRRIWRPLLLRLEGKSLEIKLLFMKQLKLTVPKSHCSCVFPFSYLLNFVARGALRLRRYNEGDCPILLPTTHLSVQLPVQWTLELGGCRSWLMKTDRGAEIRCYHWEAAAPEKQKPKKSKPKACVFSIHGLSSWTGFHLLRHAPFHKPQDGKCRGLYYRGSLVEKIVEGLGCDLYALDMEGHGGSSNGPNYVRGPGNKVLSNKILDKNANQNELETLLLGPLFMRHGLRGVIEDAKNLYRQIRLEHGTEMPIIALGHSTGSLVLSIAALEIEEDNKKRVATEATGFANMNSSGETTKNQLKCGGGASSLSTLSTASGGVNGGTVSSGTVSQATSLGKPDDNVSGQNEEINNATHGENMENGTPGSNQNLRSRFETVPEKVCIRPEHQGERVSRRGSVSASFFLDHQYRQTVESEDGNLYANVTGFSREGGSANQNSKVEPRIERDKPRLYSQNTNSTSGNGQRNDGRRNGLSLITSSSTATRTYNNFLGVISISPLYGFGSRNSTEWFLSPTDERLLTFLDSVCPEWPVDFWYAATPKEIEGRSWPGSKERAGPGSKERAGPGSSKERAGPDSRERAAHIGAYAYTYKSHPDAYGGSVGNFFNGGRTSNSDSRGGITSDSGESLQGYTTKINQIPTSRSDSGEDSGNAGYGPEGGWPVRVQSALEIDQMKQMQLNEPSALGRKPELLGFRRGSQSLARVTSATFTKVASAVFGRDPGKDLPGRDSGKDLGREQQDPNDSRVRLGGKERRSDHRNDNHGNLQSSSSTDSKNGHSSDDSNKPTVQKRDSMFPTTSLNPKVYKMACSSVELSAPELSLDRELDPLIHYPITALYANFGLSVHHFTRKLRESAHEFPCPLLILHSQIDPTTPFQASKRLMKTLPCAKLVEVDSLHNPHLEEGCEEVHKVITDWIQEITMEKIIN